MDLGPEAPSHLAAHEPGTVGTIPLTSWLLFKRQVDPKMVFTVLWEGQPATPHLLPNAFWKSGITQFPLFGSGCATEEGQAVVSSPAQLWPGSCFLPCQ